MPKIADVIKAPAKLDIDNDLLNVINAHPDYVWSESMEDLSELARWLMDPGAWFSVLPEVLSLHPPGKSLTLNSWLEVKVKGGLGRPQPAGASSRIFDRGGNRDTPTLRTVRNHLIKLYEDDKIARLLIHQSNYYASKRSEKRLVSQIAKGTFQRRGIGSDRFAWDDRDVMPPSEISGDPVNVPDDDLEIT